MYELRKISPSAYNTDGSKIYEVVQIIRTFRGLIAFIQRNDQFYTCGKGSDVFVNDVRFCHTSDLSYHLGGDSMMALGAFKKAMAETT